MRNKTLLVTNSIILLILVGCAGLADYTIPLPNEYRIDRLSAHQIGIYGEEPVVEQGMVKGNVNNYNYVPPKITDIWWNDNYIIAKQVTLQSINGGVAEPNEEQFAFWVVDMHAHIVYGPLDEKALIEQKKLLNLSEEMELIPIEDLSDLRQ
ncbi:DUF3997 domain-containing protein [Lysinibacillus sp. NPDC092081]|uniref:DUF3997 domain-containing protein n=1 Tax=Lysinibacillus sp. NPDC092081 TaxID=3364131 RepID=UPI0037F82807